MILGGFNKLMTALIVVFAVTFLGLLAEIFYVLWRRRHGDSVVLVQAKKCAYLFGWRKQSRIEPNEIPTRIDDESELDEEEKWLELCGQSRMLFTIKEEEEREGTESVESDCCSFVAIAAKRNQASADPECESDPTTRIQIDDDRTPFETPCASPPYYTPSPSPTREHDVDSSNFMTEDKVSEAYTSQFLAVKVCSQ